MNDEIRQATQEHREALDVLNAESEKYIVNLSSETMALPESFINAVRREQEAFEKLKKLSSRDT